MILCTIKGNVFSWGGGGGRFVLTLCGRLNGWWDVDVVVVVVETVKLSKITNNRNKAGPERIQICLNVAATIVFIREGKCHFGLCARPCC